MPQAFFARKYRVPHTDPKEEVYKPVPYYYGTLTTQDAAAQISEESSLTKGDVLNVLDRYQHYVIQNLQKGYKIELLGFGTLLNRFVTRKGVGTAEEVKAGLITRVIPAFKPAFIRLNGSRRYLLQSERTTLTRVSFDGSALPEEPTEPGEPGGDGGDGEL